MAYQRLVFTNAKSPFFNFISENFIIEIFAYPETIEPAQLNQIKNAIPLRFALGFDSEIVEMSPSRQGNEGGTGVGKGGDKVELRSIDSFDFRNVSLIKIDVEGYEKFVIDGAWETMGLHPKN